MTTVTLDTNLVDDQRVATAARTAGFEIVHTTVTDRELDGSGVTAVADRKAEIVEALVLGESVIGASVLGSDSDATNFETVLKMISDGAFPAKGKRDNLSAGQRRQMRDAMIFCTHVREKRCAFVTNDKKGFIDSGRRELLERRFTTKILTADEFLQLCTSKNAGESV